MLLANMMNVLAFADLHFLVTADWGGLPVWPWVSPAQTRVAAAMGDVAERHGARFVLSLGDHFYFHCIRSADDPRWQRTFEEPFAAPSLLGEGFWRIVSGNHDHAGNLSGLLEYAARPGSRWHYPAVQHSWRETLDDDDSTTTVDFVLIDTVLLCGMPRKQPPLSAGDARAHARVCVCRQPWLCAARSLGATPASAVCSVALALGREDDRRFRCRLSGRRWALSRPLPIRARTRHLLAQAAQAFARASACLGLLFGT